MKLPPALLIVGMLAVSGWAEEAKLESYSAWAEEAKLIPISAEPYSAELVKKAKAGDASAQRNLGVCYGGGQGVGKDEKEAVKWFTKSAEQGEANAKKALEYLKSK